MRHFNIPISQAQQASIVIADATLRLQLHIQSACKLHGQITVAWQVDFDHAELRASVV